MWQNLAVTVMNLHPHACPRAHLYCSLLMRSGDMYVTVPRNVWHCERQAKYSLASKARGRWT